MELSSVPIKTSPFSLLQYKPSALTPINVFSLGPLTNATSVRFFAVDVVNYICVWCVN